jgi:hypothetical protein
MEGDGCIGDKTMGADIHSCLAAPHRRIGVRRAGPDGLPVFTALAEDEKKLERIIDGAG